MTERSILEILMAEEDDEDMEPLFLALPDWSSLVAAGGCLIAAAACWYFWW